MPSLGKLNNGCEYNILPSPLRRELAHKKNRSIGSNGSSSKKQHLSSSSSLKLRQNTSISYNPTVSRTNEVEEIDDSDDEGHNNDNDDNCNDVVYDSEDNNDGNVNDHGKSGDVRNNQNSHVAESDKYDF